MDQWIRIRGARQHNLKNLDLDLLKGGLPLDDRQEDAVLAFLETLTDKRYEPLLEK